VPAWSHLVPIAGVCKLSIGKGMRESGRNKKTTLRIKQSKEVEKY
jgi:hypothetical protein